MKRLFLFLFAAALVRSASAPLPFTTTVVDSSEDTTVTITKVITAMDGGAAYRSYVVKWKDQEVVIVDHQLLTERKVGETLPIRVLRHPLPGVQDGRRVMTFAIIPPPRAGSTPPVAPKIAPVHNAAPELSAEEHKRRQEAMDAEVERRRVLREAAASAIQSAPAAK